MGRASRKRPARLAKKLAAIRAALRLSQDQIVVEMGLAGELIREEVSKFELGTREPPLPVLLAYARLAGVYVDVLIDDKLDLPKKLPAWPKSEGIPRVRPTRR